MSKILFHPPHVAEALDRLDGLDGEAVLPPVRVTDTGSPDFIPPEALVRLLRRCRADPDRKLERAVAAALVGSVRRWVSRRYGGLSPENRDDMRQRLLLHVSEQVAAVTAIDWWEITFHVKLERAAADFYPRLFDLPPGTSTVDFSTHDQVINDEWEQAGELVANVVRRARLAEILTPPEVEMFWLLFMSPVPLASANATVDLVRLLDKSEGTLRGIKTAIRKKLTEASKESPL